MFRVRLDVPTPAPGRVRVEGSALHHLRVARVVPGEALEVFDGRVIEAKAVVSSPPTTSSKVWGRYFR